MRSGVALRFDDSRSSFNGQAHLGLTVKNKNLVYKLVGDVSENVLICARPGAGKSNMMKVLYSWIAKKRQLMVFDWEGEDHKLSYFRNSDPINLPPGLELQGFDRKRARFYAYHDNPLPHQRIAIPNINNYDVDELEAVGFSESAAIEFKRLMRRYGGQFKDLADVVDFIRLYPDSAQSAASMAKKPVNEWFKRYLPGDRLNQNTKTSLVKSLDFVVAKKMFRLDDKMEAPWIDDLRAGLHVFFDYGGFFEKAQVDIIHKLKRLFELRTKEQDDFPRVYLCYEEADALFQKSAEGDKSVKKVQKQGIYTVLRARKKGLGGLYCCPSIERMHPLITRNCYEKILGPMEGADLDELRTLTKDPYLTEQVRNLKLMRPRNKGDKFKVEFIFQDEQKRAWIFEPFMSPCEIHREKKKGEEDE